MSPQRHRTFLVILALTAISIAGISAVALGTGLVGGDAPGLRPQDVVDAESGEAYLVQAIELYYLDTGAEPVGVFEFFRVPIREVWQFQRSLGISDTAWEEAAADTAVVLTWSSPEASFAPPRAPYGVDSRLAGDTFLIIIEPAAGLEVRAVVSRTALEQLRFAATDRVEAEMAISPEPSQDP